MPSPPISLPPATPSRLGSPTLAAAVWSEGGISKHPSADEGRADRPGKGQEPPPPARWLTGRAAIAQLYSHFGESITGSSSIRAAGAEERFCRDNWQRVDRVNRLFGLMNDCNRWLAIRLELCGPPPSRTNWTRLVPPSVLTGHVSSAEPEARAERVALPVCAVALPDHRLQA